jgi:TRAP-type C4-dicarboxylate transport system permease small subunit
MSKLPHEERAAASAAVLRWTRNALTGLVCVVMFAMMMVIVVDVAGRALFRLPVKGSDELVAFLLALLIFSALPLVTWDREHITVMLFDRWIRGGVARVLNALLSATSTLVVAFIAYRMWIQADLMREGQHLTGALQWPIAPVVYISSVLSGFAAAILAFLTWQDVSGRSPPSK